MSACTVTIKQVGSREIHITSNQRLCNGKVKTDIGELLCKEIEQHKHVLDCNPSATDPFCLIVVLSRTTAFGTELRSFVKSVYAVVLHRHIEFAINPAG